MITSKDELKNKAKTYADLKNQMDLIEIQYVGDAFVEAMANFLNEKWVPLVEAEVEIVSLRKEIGEELTEKLHLLHEARKEYIAEIESKIAELEGKVEQFHTWLGGKRGLLFPEFLEKFVEVWSFKKEEAT